MLFTGVRSDELCNTFVITGQPKNLTCPLLFSSSDTTCALEEGDMVVWRVYVNVSPPKRLYYGSINDFSGTDMEPLKRLYVSQSHALVIPSADELFHANISCTVGSASNSSRPDEIVDKCSELFIQLLFTTRKLSNIIIIKLYLCNTRT